MRMWQGEQNKPPLGKKKISKYAVASASFCGNVMSILPFFTVSQSGLAGDVCPDPGVPENGKRMGSAFQ